MNDAISEAESLLGDQIQTHVKGGRTDSAGLLAWFLQHVWRLDPEEVDSAICDGGGDKGVDALVVDDDLNEITILQAKYRREPTRVTVGDKDMKELVGAAGWFDSRESVDQLLESGPNRELRNLISRQEVRSKLDDGAHAVKLVFVTNAPLDSAGTSYRDLQAAAAPPLEVWDGKMLAEVALRTQRPDFLEHEMSISSDSIPIKLSLSTSTRMALCLVPAKELVLLPGIADRTVFGRNVRLFAGRTRINRELQSTVGDSKEHRLFPAFHNGMTLLTRRIIDSADDSVTFDGVAVVNGCQSLVTLFDNATSLTDELKVLVKIVEVGDSEAIADLITYRSNNQNPVTMRDQRSSDSAMRDLKHGVAEIFDNEFALVTRLGESAGARVELDNALAAQLIMAAYLSEPWAAVRKVRLFDQDYRRIFNRHVTPWRLYLLHLIDEAVSAQRRHLGSELRGSFSSVRFALVYLVAELLRSSQQGEGLLEAPEAWLPEEATAVSAVLEEMAREVVESVNDHVETELNESDDFDPKTIFKSQVGIQPLRKDVVRDARRQERRKDSYLFSVAPAERR